MVGTLEAPSSSDGRSPPRQPRQGSAPSCRPSPAGPRAAAAGRRRGAGLDSRRRCRSRAVSLQLSLLARVRRRAQRIADMATRHLRGITDSRKVDRSAPLTEQPSVRLRSSVGRAPSRPGRQQPELAADRSRAQPRTRRPWARVVSAREGSSARSIVTASRGPYWFGHRGKRAGSDPPHGRLAVVVAST